MAQVKSLQQELQMLASNRPMTIVTNGGTGGRKYGIVILVVVVGYGVVWMKGWKLPDMMFATKRSLSDACSSVARQLESVYSSIAATKRNLSSKLDHVDKSLEESLDLTADTQEQVLELRGRSDAFGRDIKSVHHVVQNLENRIWNIEGKQDVTNEGIRRLCNHARNMENQRTTERVQAIPSSSSRPSLELPPTTPSPKQNQPSLIGFSPDPSESNVSPNQVHRRSLQSAVSDAGLMLNGATIVNTPSSSSSSSIDTTSNGSSSTSDSPRREVENPGLPGLGFLTRTRSAMSAVFRQARPSTQS